MMHSALFEGAPVLSLAPDSIASLGELDSSSLSDLWGVFTKCKDSLQNGRRLENLSWRLWFDSGRRELNMFGAEWEEKRGTFSAEKPLVRAAHEVDWSDPEWTEATTDSESDEEGTRGGRPRQRCNATIAKTTSSPPPSAAPTAQPPSTGHASRPPLAVRAGSGGPFDRRSSTTISGGSLQRMITGFTDLPLTTRPAKARSVVDVSTPALLTPPVSTTAQAMSAPETLETTRVAPLSFPSPPPSSTASRATVDARTQTIPSSSHRPSPTMSRQPSVALACSGSFRAMTKPTLPVVASPPPQASTSKSTIVPAPRRSSSARRTNSTVAVPAASGHLRMAARAESDVQLHRTFSSGTSFEPRSFVKGFDTRPFESQPRQGSIAPPPTPAPGPAASLAASPPPSAMRSANKPSMASKKIFFISSPASDSEDDSSSSHSGRLRSPTTKGAQARRTSQSPKSPLGIQLVVVAPIPADEVPPPLAGRAPPQGRPPPQGEANDEWASDNDEDDDEDDDDASSGWGSEYSTESDVPAGGRGAKVDSRPQGLFAKRPPSVTPTTSELKPRPPGLLSQLFHPGQFLDDGDRSYSAIDMTRARKASPTLQMSKSTGVLTEQLRNKSFLRGAPAGTEMDSSSEDDDDYEDEEDEAPLTNEHAVGLALARHQREEAAAAALAAPQTPRTTRRAMLATELSESLRRNLLWERQTRNRIMGGPVDGRFQPLVPPRPPLASTTSLLPPPPQPLYDGLRAPHPSPATRDSSPVQPMVRRHTTGTGLYLAAQTGFIAKGRGSGESMSEQSGEETQAPADVYGSAFTSGLHHHGW